MTGSADTVVENSTQETDDPTTAALLGGEDFAVIDGGYSMSAGGALRTAGVIGGGTAAYGMLSKNKVPIEGFLDNQNAKYTDSISDRFEQGYDASEQRMDDALDPEKSRSAETKRGEQRTVDKLQEDPVEASEKKADKKADKARKDALKDGQSNKKANKAADAARDKVTRKAEKQSLKKGAEQTAKKVGQRATVEGAKKAAAFGAKKIGSRAAAMAMAALVPGPGWALAVGIGVTVGIELLTGPLGKWVGGLFNASGPSTDSPPSGGNTWLPSVSEEEE
ncbi:hypothetical protein [Corynebacterium sp. AOP12-C2-36]|uniref:hypothetical protein n=1 Tax=Corynebacterium sp. AOP12-C2-36 TaxID=3457723 RepID=UPI004033D8F6